MKKKSTPVELIPLIEWWEKDGKSTVMWLAIALMMVGGYYSYTHLSASRKEASSEALFAATTAEELAEAAEKYGSSAAGSSLQMRLASALYNKGDFEGALAAYEKLAANPPEGFADVPVIGKAQCLEALKKFDEALAIYKSFAESKPKSFLATTARLGEARCLAAKKENSQALLILADLEDAPSASAALKAQVEEVRDLITRPPKAAPAVKAEAVSEALKVVEPEKK